MSGNNHISLIQKYFPGLTQEQLSRFGQLGPLYNEWNAKINVISRKDIEHLYEHHILHSLALARIISLPDGLSVLDVGTGGGFPGIPLAILFPRVKFHLIDGTHKKIRVVNEIIAALELTNVTAFVKRSEELKHQYNIITGRAVSEIGQFAKNVQNLLKKGKGPFSGIYYWTGETDAISAKKQMNCKLFPIAQLFSEKYFEGKYLIHAYY